MRNKLIVFAVGLFLGAILSQIIKRALKNEKPKEAILSTFDSLAYVKHIRDSFEISNKTKERKDSILEAQVNSLIKTTYKNEKSAVILSADSVQLIIRKRILAKLDSERLVY